MKVPYAWRPGAGFVILALAVLGSAGFFAWGWSTPLLDHVGRIELELKIGRRAPLTTRELAQVQEALCRHPKIADDWLGDAAIGLVSNHRRGVVENGYAYLVRQPGASAMVVSVERPAGDARKQVHVRARTRSDQIAGDVPLTWAAPRFGDCPTIIEIIATESGEKKKPARVRIGWKLAEGAP